MGGIACTLLAYLFGGEYTRPKRDDFASFALLDLYRAGANRAFFGLCDKLDTGKRLAGLGRCPNNFRCRPTSTLRMPV